MKNDYRNVIKFLNLRVNFDCFWWFHTFIALIQMNILGSDDEEQEDPNDYTVGGKF